MIRTPHKWQNVIIAWSNGEQFQYKHITEDSNWVNNDHTNPYAFGLSMLITADKDYEFRVKPDPVILKYRNALIKTKSGKYKIIAINLSTEDDSLPFFNKETIINWVDDIKEIDLNPFMAAIKK